MLKESRQLYFRVKNLQLPLIALALFYGRSEPFGSVRGLAIYSYTPWIDQWMVPSKQWPVPEPKGTFTVNFDIFGLEGPSGASTHLRQRSGRLAELSGAFSRVKGDIGIRVVRPY